MDLEVEDGTGHLWLKMADVEGFFWVYTKIINQKNNKRVQTLMGATGTSDSHANVPSPVNYDSKYFFSSWEQSTHSVGATIEISRQDYRAQYKELESDYTLHVLVVAKGPIVDSENESEKGLSIGKFKVIPKLEAEEEDDVHDVTIVLSVLLFVGIVGTLIYHIKDNHQRRTQ